MQQKPEKSTFRPNRTNLTQTEQHLPITRNKTQLLWKVQVTRGVDINNTTDTPTTQEEDFPLSPSLVSSIPHLIPNTNVWENLFL